MIGLSSKCKFDDDQTLTTPTVRGKKEKKTRNMVRPDTDFVG